MSAKVVAFFNQSGGVGKTSLTMNIGYHLAKNEQKVLLVDMDPQCSLTAFMGLEPSELDKTVYEAILVSEILAIHRDLNSMDLLPANINLSGAELELVTADMRDLRFKDAIEPILNDYDFVLVDCPPSLGILSYISLVAATHVLIPIQTEYKSLKGTELLLKTIARVRQRANRHIQIAGVVPNMYDARTIQGEQSLQSICQAFSTICHIYPPIPRTVTFADASQQHIPLALYSPKHPVVKLLDNIALHLKKLQ